MWCTKDFQCNVADDIHAAWPTDAVCAYGIFKLAKERFNERAILHAVIASSDVSAHSGVSAMMSLQHLAGLVHSLNSDSVSQLFQHISFGGT